MLRIGIDIGGTFTDFAIWRGDASGYGGVTAMKTPSTPPRFAEGVIAGLQILRETGRLTPDEDVLIVHGTTVSTNAVIERSGPPLALLVTAGFRDILGVARAARRPPDRFVRAPPATADSAPHGFEVDERLLADGSVDRALRPDQVAEAATAARDAGAAAIAVCLLHAHRNPVHERAAAAAIQAAFLGWTSSCRTRSGPNPANTSAPVPPC